MDAAADTIPPVKPDDPLMHAIVQFVADAKADIAAAEAAESEPAA